MKKLVTVLMTLSTIAIFGQNHFIGLKSGISLTNIRADDFFENTNFKTGFLGGFTYEYQFANSFHLGCELVYTQKGFKDEVTFTDLVGNPIGGVDNIKNNYDYLSLPIKGGFSIGGNFAGFLNLGIVSSLLINAETITPPIGNNPGENYDVTDLATKFDLGGMIEVGGSYQLMERYTLYTSLAYNQSFTPIDKDDYFADCNVKHYGITLSVGVKYAL